MKFYVVIDSEDGEVGGVTDKRSKAIAMVSNNNAMKYDMPSGGQGGFGVVEVDANNEKDAVKMAQSKIRVTKQESKTYYNRYLGDDAVTEYTKIKVKGMTQEALDEAYNDYFQGHTDDFKKKMKTVSEVAQFTSFLIENGLDIRLINQMLKTLA